MFDGQLKYTLKTQSITDISEMSSSFLCDLFQR